MEKDHQSGKVKEFMRVVKFTLISISAGIIQIGLFTLLNLTLGKVITNDFWHYVSCSLPALVASVLWNFTINRKITFKSAANVKKAMLLVFLFYAVFTPVTTILGGVAADNIKWNPTALDFIIQAVTMILNFVLEFLYTRFIVYRNSCDTAVKKDEGNVENS